MLSNHLRPVIVALVCATGLWCAPRFGVGASDLADPLAAGEAAARQAAVGLAGGEPKIAVVFAARRQLVPDLVEGIAKVLPKDRIYGCEGYSPLATGTNFADQGHNAQHAVSVLLVGGDAEPVVASASTQVEGGWLACGRALGEKLKPAYEPGRGVLLTFGDQHVGTNNRDLVQGLREALGDRLPLVGAAAGNSAAKEIVAGEVVAATNVLILLKGDFHVRTIMRGGGDREEYLKRTAEAFETVFDARQKPLLALVFNCGGRRGVLAGQKRLAEEFAVMKAHAGDAPLFGLYGGGEVGCPQLGEAPQGVGYHVAVAAVLPDAPPE